MNWRKHMVLLVGGGIALLLMILALVFLMRARGEYQEINDQLIAASGRLDQLNRRSPFPSEDNIKMMEQNLRTLQDATEDLYTILLKGQVRPERIEAAEFAPLLERATKRLYQRAAENGVLLPERFNLGLARYAAGELPAREAIPRLVVQLKCMDALCQILFQARIHSLVSIERQQFESAAPVEEVISSRRRAAVQQETTAQGLPDLPMPASNTLYEVERFGLTFAARDASVWEALNLLNRTPLVAAVVDVQLANQASEQLGKAQPVAPLGGDQPAAQVLARYPSHEERVIAGRELVQASVVVDVYRILPPVKETAP